MTSSLPWQQQGAPLIACQFVRAALNAFRAASTPPGTGGRTQPTAALSVARSVQLVAAM